MIKLNRQTLSSTNGHLIKSNAHSCHACLHLLFMDIFCVNFYILKDIYVHLNDIKIFQLIDKARDYFGLADLEQQNNVGGFLSVHIADALSPSVTVPGGFAGESQGKWIFWKSIF